MISWWWYQFCAIVVNVSFVLLVDAGVSSAQSAGVSSAQSADAPRVPVCQL